MIVLVLYKYYNLSIKKTTSVVFLEGGNKMSKLVEANKKIEEAVVGGYKKVEDAVVGGYKSVEDKFVDTFLKKDGETTKEAKERIKEEQAALEKKNEEVLKKSKEINDKYTN